MTIKVTINTGRTYNGKQVIECEEIGREFASVIFLCKDASRGMKFKVHVLSFDPDNENSDYWVRHILDMYDSGDYQNA